MIKLNLRASAFLIVLLLIAFFSVGVYIGYPGVPANTQSNPVYDLNLVITNTSSGNQTIAGQDLFFVYSDNTLSSSAVIRVPFGTEVKITIVNYDHDLDPILTSSASAVSGVLGNEIHVSGLNSGFTGSGTPAISMNYNTVSPFNISHTFTTTSGINIPIEPDSTTTAFVVFDSYGSISWACMCLCGEMSMQTPGWMMGEIVVY